VDPVTTVRVLVIDSRASTCIEKICGGKPQRPRMTQNPVAVVKWVDGSVIDSVWGIE
jgi:citrate lyase alpha subunit